MGPDACWRYMNALAGATDSEAPLDLTRTESQVEVYDMDAEPVEITKDEVEEVRASGNRV